MFAGLQCASANMLTSAVLFSSLNKFSINDSKNDGMYLGQWRNQISNKINPSYFNHLSGDDYSGIYSGFKMIASSIHNSNHFQTPVFTNSRFSKENSLLFSFVSDNIKLTPFDFNQLVQTITPKGSFSSRHSKLDNKPNLIEQQYYAPGYVYSKGSSSLGVSAVFVQQRFLDDSFSFFSLASSSQSQLYSDKAFINSNKGTGYQYNYRQKLPANLKFAFNYQSKINMNEFDSIGRSYSQQGEFDIPSQMTMTLGIPFLDSNNISFSAEKISYSTIKTTVHSGYSQTFLNAYNSIVSPQFKLDDLLVYSVRLQRNVNKRLSWIIDVTSRQQAPATKAVYDNILKNETADFNYKVGLRHRAGIGEFNIFASFANKPILIGTTDFGRLSNTSLTNHVEGVLSWSASF